MRICVYGAANDSIDDRHLEEGNKMGRLLAAKGHGLVFGAGDTGMIGAVARGFAQNDGHICGIAPTFFDRPGVLYQGCDEMIFTETMRERKQLMEDKSDAFIVTPGGLGTLEEFFEILTLKQLARHQKPIIIFNHLGYYDPLLALLSHTVEQGFARQSDAELVKVATTAEEVAELL